MKRFALAILAVVLLASFAWAAPELLGTTKMKAEDRVMQTVFAHPKSNTTGLINTTGATASWPTNIVCDTGSVIFETITGADIKNVALQVGYDLSPGYTETTVFWNTIGTSSEPWHPITNGNTDTYKFDFSSRAFNRWRLDCLVGCDITNTISEVYGTCWRSGR